VNAHYEAVRLDREHPTVAHLIHVATIEGIGARLVQGNRVARKRFRAALSTVMTEGEAEQLARLAYKLRSSTAHTGDLFGSERTFGYPLGLLFQQTDDLIFDYAILGRLRQASRRVLIKALQDACAQS
jgi:hypothetical protein